MLIRTDEIRIDRMGAVTLPLELVKVLQDGDPHSDCSGLDTSFTLNYGFGNLREGSLTAYTTSTTDLIDNSIASRPRGSKMRKMLQHFFIVNSIETKLNENGKFLIPRKLRHDVENVVTIAVNNRFSLVSKENWQEIKNCNEVERVSQLMSKIGLTKPFSQSEESLDNMAGDFATVLQDFLKCNNRDWRLLEYQVAEVFAKGVEGLVELTRPAKDDGIDVFVRIAKDGKARNLYVQVKSGERKATVSDVRELIGVTARDGADIGLLVTTSGATSNAVREARSSKVKVSISRIQELASWIERGFWENVIG